MKMNRPFSASVIFARTLCVVSLCFVGNAMAHPGHGIEATFAMGFMHPLSGFDHLLAMLAVGLCAARYAHTNKMMTAVLPITFIVALVAGLMLGTMQVAIPAVEPMIALSLLVLGLVASVRYCLPPEAAIAVVALFAGFHGYAHGSEMGGHIDAVIGVALSSALLHGTGVLLGMQTQLRRVLAGGVAASGVFLLLQFAA